MTYFQNCGSETKSKQQSHSELRSVPFPTSVTDTSEPTKDEPETVKLPSEIEDMIQNSKMNIKAEEARVEGTVTYLPPEVYRCWIFTYF